jgi:hypothetical protein
MGRGTEEVALEGVGPLSRTILRGSTPLAIGTSRSRYGAAHGWRAAAILVQAWALDARVGAGWKKFVGDGLGARRQNQSFRAKALYEAGMLARFQGDFARARMLCEQSLASYRTLGR